MKSISKFSQNISRRELTQFGDKLYLEFGGKLFDDYHASRVLRDLLQVVSFRC